MAPAGSGDTCPVGLLENCNGGCTPAAYVGDGICDAELNCQQVGDGGDCPEAGLVLPNWMVYQCPGVTAQSGFCLTLGEVGSYTTEPTLIGLDDGAACSLGTTFVGASAYDLYNLAWVPPYRTAVACDMGYGGLFEFDLRTGITRFLSGTGCQGLTALGNSLLMETWYGWERYSSFDDVGLGNGQPIVVPIGSSSRFGASGQILYGTWHSTDTAVAADLGQGVPLPDIPLAGFDGWNHGVDAVDGHLWITTRDDIRAFDATTGAAGPIYPNSRFYGLECYDP